MKIAFITTCMNRFIHANQSVPKILEDPRIDGVNNFLVFVDYACPMRTGTFIKNNFPQTNVVVCGEQESLFFHKSAAQNIGANHATELGADYFVFIDVDTIVTPLFLDFVFNHAHSEEFMIMCPPREHRDLCGFLGVPKKHFQKVDGYDLRFFGWGGVDLDMRLRLFLKAKIEWSVVPYYLAGYIPHEDTLRDPKSKRESYLKNSSILDQNLFDLTGQTRRQLFDTPLGTKIKTLLGLK